MRGYTPVVFCKSVQLADSVPVTKIQKMGVRKLSYLSGLQVCRFENMGLEMKKAPITAL